MKGFESVIQGYAEGGSVSSNPFEAYYRSSLANPFAGLMNLPARPQYVPRATTPTTTSPLRGYMDIYGNLAAIREEQARRRAAAAPAPQEDQPSQGSEPTTGPAPTPDPDLTLRDIETTVPVDPDFSDITSPDAGRADEASIPTAPTAPSPEDLELPGFGNLPAAPPSFETPPPDLSIEYPAEAMPMPDTGIPQLVAPGPVELGLPGFDEAQPVIPPGLGFDSIPAPDLTLPDTREDLPPPEAGLPLNYEEAAASIPATREDVVENPLEQVLESYTPSPVVVDEAVPAPPEAMPVVDPGEVFSDLPPTNPLQDILVDGTLPEPIQDAPAQEIAETTPEISEDKITPTDDYSKSVVPSDEDLIPVTQPIPVVPSRQIETTIEDYDLPPAFEDVAAMPVFDPDAVEVGAIPAEIGAIAPPSNPLQDIAVDVAIPDVIQETPAYSLADVLDSDSDDAYATPPEIENVAGVTEGEDVAAIQGTSPVYDLANALALTEAPQTITEVAPQLETVMEDYSLPTTVEEVATAPSLQDIAVDGTLPEYPTDYAEVVSDEAPVLSLADVLKSDEDYAAPIEVPAKDVQEDFAQVGLPTTVEDVAGEPAAEDVAEVTKPSAVEEVAPAPPTQDIAVDSTLPSEVAQAPKAVDVDEVLGGTASDVLSGASNDESAKAPEKSTLADLAKAVFSGIGTTSPLGLANMLGGMAATQALKGEEAAPMSLTQMALEKIAPSLASTGISAAAKQEMIDRGNLAGNQMAEAVAQGQISKDAAATALTNDINLVGSLGHALAALEAGTKAVQGTEDTDLALSPGDSSDGESGESDTGTAPSTDVGPPSGFDGGFGSGFDFGGYDGGGYDGGGSDSDSGGGGGSESEGSSGGSESDGGGWAEGGYIPGDSGGMDDDVPALIDGKEPAKLSSGEFVFDAATVAALGDGNNEAGAKKLNMLREAIRKKAYGHKKQPPKNFSVGDLVRLYDRMR